MEIILSNSSNEPIYQQITSQIKTMIIDGTLKTGDSMPSMRNLAKSLHVSVITAQHAYEDLQKDGFIETVAGKGTFVSPVLLKIRILLRKSSYGSLKKKLKIL